MNRISKAAERYSTALFQAAQSGKQLDAIGRDFEQLGTLLATHLEFSHVLFNPLFPKQNVLVTLDKLGTELKLSQATKDLLRLLVAKRRINLLPQILQRYTDLYIQDKGMLPIRVTTHSSLSEDQIKGLEQALQKKTGKEPMLEIEHDPSILGGLIIEYGSYKLDYSLRRKLTELKQELERLS